MPDDGVWKNLLVEEKKKVAETLAEFRGNYKYNLLDGHLRAFNASVPTLAQWERQKCYGTLVATVGHLSRPANPALHCSLKTARSR